MSSNSNKSSLKPSAGSLMSQAFRKFIKSKTHNGTDTFEEISGWTKDKEGVVNPQVITAFLNHFGENEIEHRPEPWFSPTQSPTKLTIKEIFKVIDDKVAGSKLGKQLEDLDKRVSRWKTARTGVRGSAVTGDLNEVPRYPLDWDEDLATLSHTVVGTLIECAYEDEI